MYDYLVDYESMDVDDISDIQIGEYLDNKNCACEKRLFSKLVLACEDKILNTIDTT